MAAWKKELKLFAILVGVSSWLGIISPSNLLRNSKLSWPYKCYVLRTPRSVLGRFKSSGTRIPLMITANISGTFSGKMHSKLCQSLLVNETVRSSLENQSVVVASEIPVSDRTALLLLLLITRRFIFVVLHEWYWNFPHCECINVRNNCTFLLYAQAMPYTKLSAADNMLDCLFISSIFTSLQFITIKTFDHENAHYSGQYCFCMRYFQYRRTICRQL